MDLKVNNKSELWLNKKYGNLEEVKAIYEKKHNYLGMLFDFNEKGKVKINMSSYVKNMINEILVKFKSTDKAMMPVTEILFSKGQAK